MKAIPAYLTVQLLLASCQGDQQGTGDHAPPVYPAPQTLPIKTSVGYSINAVTGDSIHPLISSSGVTIVTGLPVPATGRVIHQDSVAQARVIAAGDPKVDAANLLLHCRRRKNKGCKQQ